MSDIQANTVGTLSLGTAPTADNTIIVTTELIGVTAFNIQNNAAVTRVIDIYSSADETSAAGKKVTSVKIAAGKDKDVSAVIGQNYTLNLIAVPDGNDCEATMSYLQFTGDAAP